MVGLLPSQYRAVSFDFFQIEFAEMVGLHELATMFDQRSFDGEVDAKRGRGLIVVRGIHLPFCMVSEVLVFELAKVSGRDLDFLVADQFDALVAELVIQAADKTLFELR